MLTILFALAVLWGLIGLIRRRPAAALAGFFLLFSLVSRTGGLVYVDLAGPVYSEQLGSFIGGGASMPLFATSVLILLGSLAFAFRPSVLIRVQVPRLRSGRGGEPAMHLLFAVAACFIIALYGDMFSRGVVPLFVGMDRLEYNAQIAGPLHTWLAEMGFLLAGPLGAGFCLPRLRGGDFKFRFLVLYFLILVYFALTGNRFSAFYSFTSFFVLPIAAIPAMSSVDMLPAPPERSGWRRFALSKTALMMVISAGALVIAALLLNSVINVRGYDDPLQALTQRTLVQPVELWWTTWNDLGRYSSDSFGDTWNGLFINPIDPTRNTSIQVLMLKNLGGERSQELLGMGQQYAGGYPEILFELLGVWLALPAVLMFSLSTATLLRMCVIAVCERRFMTAFMSLYVVFGFSLLFIGGMLNFLVAWTFWVKCGLLAVAALFERFLNRGRASRPGRQVLPSGLPSCAT